MSNQTTKTNQPLPELELGVWGMFKTILNAVMGSTLRITSAIDSTAGICEELADTGLVMAKANKDLVTIESDAKTAIKKAALESKYTFA